MARINPFSSITVLQGDQYLKVATINSLKSLVIVDFVIQINNQEIPTGTTTSTTFRVAGVVNSTQAQLIASGRSDSIPSGSVHIWVVPSTSGIPGDLYDIYIESSSQISGYWEDLTSTGELMASTIQQVESLTGTKLQEFWNSPGVEAASKFSHPMVVVMNPTLISNSGYDYFADIVINRATVVVDLSIKVASINNPSHWVEFLLKGTINDQGVIDLHAYSSSEIVGSKGIGYSGNTSDGKIKLWFQFDEYCVGFWTNNNPMSTITAVNALAVQDNPGITLVPTKYLIYKDLAIEQLDIPAPPDQTDTYTLRSVAGVLTWQ